MVRGWNDAKGGGPDPGPLVDRRRLRAAWAEVDIGALVANAATLARLAAPASLCAVVKADGYGHGALTAARAALVGGAVGVAVALVEEGVRLRDGQFAEPILLLGEPPPGSEAEVAEMGLEPTVESATGVERLVAAARSLGRRVPVHVKVDTGMHRAGAAPGDLVAVCQAVADAGPNLVLAGLWTHLAVAEGGSAEDRAFTELQLRRFADARRQLAAQGIEPPVLHVANSAGAVVWPEARHQLVRCGIALYGYAPSTGVHEALVAQGSKLEPVLSLKAKVSSVRELEAGERPSYGRCRPLPTRSVVATVPLGYADGVPRRLFACGGEVLVGGRRRDLAGMVTMDQIVVDCGPDAGVRPGDEVVLLGRQGGEQITADEWAGRLGTISYEVLTSIGPRVPRTVVGDPAVLEAPPPEAEAPARGGRIGRFFHEARLH